MLQNITPDIKKQSIQWRAKFSSDTEIASKGYIIKYALHAEPRGNLVLIPGMASNCKTEPLMQGFITWGLLHKYNIYTLETFSTRCKFQHRQKKYSTRTYQFN